MSCSFAPVDHDACGVGFVAQLGSPGSREVVERALEALRRLGHRGGLDADGGSGDGAGLLTAIPDGFIRNSARKAGIELPPAYALGMVFLPGGQEDVTRHLVAKMAECRGLRFLGWRTVPTDPSIVGPRALERLFHSFSNASSLPCRNRCTWNPISSDCARKSNPGLRAELISVHFLHGPWCTRVC
jgi:glutamate synthase domain-containing protein 1